MTMRKVCRGTYASRPSPGKTNPQLFWRRRGRPILLFLRPALRHSRPMTGQPLPALPERLRLDRPLVVFDLEATGLNKRTDRIVAIALVRYEPIGTTEQVSYLLNPGIPIPEEVTRIHGIADVDVKDAPTFAEMAETIAEHFAGDGPAGRGIDDLDIEVGFADVQAVVGVAGQCPAVAGFGHPPVIEQLTAPEVGERQPQARRDGVGADQRPFDPERRAAVARGPSGRRAERHRHAGDRRRTGGAQRRDERVDGAVDRQGQRLGAEAGEAAHQEVADAAGLKQARIRPRSARCALRPVPRG